MQIRDCGLADYEEILELQRQLYEQRLAGHIGDTVLVVEHPPVITLGTRKTANKLLADAEDLDSRGINVVETGRGGGITAHNPGQIVFYPIVDLRQARLGIREYIHKLEQIGIELLKQLGVAAERRCGFVGLWVGGRKIASIGIRVSKFVTCHGMAINISNDLSIYDHIVPCGIEGVEMTSVLRQTGKQYSIDKVKSKLCSLLTEKPAIRNEPLVTSHEWRKLPAWLKRPLPGGAKFNQTRNILNGCEIETICVNANCPNRGECWDKGTATALILGSICTRGCKFCSVATGKPEPPDSTEPARLADMAEQLGLKYLVITSVNRDDLDDGGASHFGDCINAVRERCSNIQFEILTGDFKGCQHEAVEILKDALPFVFAHNIETVPRLYPVARAGSDYQRSLSLLRLARDCFGNIPTKSSIMLGLGETADEVERVLAEVRAVGCDRITIGQYLKPSRHCLDVVEYVQPKKFEYWKEKTVEMGFSQCLCEPYARSSFMAEEQNCL